MADVRKKNVKWERGHPQGRGEYLTGDWKENNRDPRNMGRESKLANQKGREHRGVWLSKKETTYKSLLGRCLRGKTFKKKGGWISFTTVGQDEGTVRKKIHKLRRKRGTKKTQPKSYTNQH